MEPNQDKSGTRNRIQMFRIRQTVICLLKGIVSRDFFLSKHMACFFRPQLWFANWFYIFLLPHLFATIFQNGVLSMYNLFHHLPWTAYKFNMRSMNIYMRLAPASIWLKFQYDYKFNPYTVSILQYYSFNLTTVSILLQFQSYYSFNITTISVFFLQGRPQQNDMLSAITV